MTNEEKDAASVEEEGQKVTGGAKKKSEEQESSSGAPGDREKGDKKERMTGYNELPEQSKVGGEESPDPDK